jgi:hypothetical protein
VVGVVAEISTVNKALSLFGSVDRDTGTNAAASTSAGVEGFIEKPKPVRKTFELTAWDQKVCGLPNGDYIITVQDTTLHLLWGGQAADVTSIVGGTIAPELLISKLSIQERNYLHGIIFNDTQKNGEVTTITNKCIVVSFNYAPQEERQYIKFKKGNVITLTLTKS